MTENEIQLIHILIQRIERLEQGFKKLQNDEAEESKWNEDRMRSLLNQQVIINNNQLNIQLWKNK